MECRFCGTQKQAIVKPDSGGKFYRGAWQCPNGCTFKNAELAERMVLSMIRWMISDRSINERTEIVPCVTVERYLNAIRKALRNIRANACGIKPVPDGDMVDMDEIYRIHDTIMQHTVSIDLPFGSKGVDFACLLATLAGVILYFEGRDIPEPDGVR